MQFLLSKLTSCFGGEASDHLKEANGCQSCVMFSSSDTDDPLGDRKEDHYEAKTTPHNHRAPKNHHRRFNTADDLREMRQRQSRALGVEFKSKEWENVPFFEKHQDCSSGRTTASNFPPQYPMTTPPRPVKSSRSITTPARSTSSSRMSSYNTPPKVLRVSTEKTTAELSYSDTSVSKSQREKVGPTVSHRNTPQRSVSVKSVRSLQSKDDIFRLKGKMKQQLREMNSVSTTVTEKLRFCFAPPAPEVQVASHSTATSMSENCSREPAFSPIHQLHAQTSDTGESGAASMYFERTISQLQASQPLYNAYQVPVTLEKQDGLADVLSVRAKSSSSMTATDKENVFPSLCFDAADAIGTVTVEKMTGDPSKKRNNFSLPPTSSNDPPQATRTESTLSMSQSSSRSRPPSCQVRVSTV